MEITRSDFQDALKAYLKDNDITITALARKVGKDPTSVGDWIRHGIRRDDIRHKIADDHPWLFNREGKLSQKEVIDKPEKRTDPNQSLLSLIKSEQARSGILVLKAILMWFLFEASAEERNQFRDSIGEDWKNFLELTRAMTGETAFEVAKQEGRLEWCQK